MTSTDRKPDGFLPTFKLWWHYVLRFTATGLLVWVPLIITLWVSWVAVSKLGFGLDNLGRGVVMQLRTIGGHFPAFRFLADIEYWPGMGVIVAIMLFFFTGFVTRYLVGRQLIQYGEQIIQRIPLIRRVYRAVQQVRDVFISRGGAVFQRVCLVEYPREGMITVAFVTSHEQGVVQQETGKEMVAVFVPTTPNPTSGYLVYLPPSEVKEIDISVEEAMKLIVSGGAYSPEYRAAPDAQASPSPTRIPGPSARLHSVAAGLFGAVTGLSRGRRQKPD